MRIYKSPTILRKVFPEALWKVDTNEKKIYLTFDDGPHEEITMWVLEELKKYNAEGTFFCLGKHVRHRQQVVKNIIAAGHSIGNHSFNHLNGWKSSPGEYVRDVRSASEWISSPLFRPPYGKLKFSQYESLKQHFQIVMWDVLSYDWDIKADPGKSLKNVIKNTERGSIVVFHDSVKAYKNLKFMLPRYLEKFSEKGYTFSTLDPVMEARAKVG
ncbi:MAG: polysaccharide deacetylase family protein [Chitinophagales bacterium]|nr:polysaccharide deacetylase family protein [Chitinophagales bacterium]